MAAPFRICLASGRWRIRALAAAVSSLAVLAACSPTPLPPATSVVQSDSDDAEESAAIDRSDPADDVAATDRGLLPDGADVLVRLDVPGSAIDRRVFGTNVPAWVGPEVLADETFRSATIASGATTLRMPGGSWSNGYNWSACELRDADECFWTWAARPTDFIDFVRSTGLEAMWTVSINATAESAAAAVAFFNGSIDDDRPIGVDRDGVDWGTVGDWASVRAFHGNVEPLGIELWEIGNEVYGGRPESGGEQCAAFGWEEVWTCDGAEYVVGDGDHDGYLEIRDAMIAVDPTVLVGGVGVADPASWSNWGNEVIELAGNDLDFYSIHHYGFDASPEAGLALVRPAAVWPALIGDLRAALTPEIPIAVTEYNLVSFEPADDQRSMTRALNAFYIADTIGQLVEGGVPIANHWNLANGTSAGGTNYGLIDLEDGSLFPQYHALSLWGATGDTLLPVDRQLEFDELRVYPTLRADGSLAVIIINLDDQPASTVLAVAGLDVVAEAQITTFRTESLDADELIDDETVAIAGFDVGGSVVDLAPWSLSLLELWPDE